MKKIKSIQQLQAEKKRIRQRQKECENKIRDNWAGLKASLKPAAIAGDVLSTVLKNRAAANLAGDSILQNTVTYGVTLLVQKLAEKAEEKFGGFFRKK